MDTEELQEKKKAVCLAIDKILTDFVNETGFWPTNVKVNQLEVSCLGWQGRLVYEVDFDLGVLK